MRIAQPIGTNGCRSRRDADFSLLIGRHGYIMLRGVASSTVFADAGQLINWAIGVNDLCMQGGIYTDQGMDHQLGALLATVPEPDPAIAFEGVSVEVAGQAVQTAARDRPFYPVKTYLRGLQWDGVERVDRWLSVYLGAEDTDYSRAVGSRWLISAVARIYRPGAKADCCLILEGPQRDSQINCATDLG